MGRDGGRAREGRGEQGRFAMRVEREYIGDAASIHVPLPGPLPGLPSSPRPSRQPLLTGQRDSGSAPVGTDKPCLARCRRRPGGGFAGKARGWVCSWAGLEWGGGAPGADERGGRAAASRRRSCGAHASFVRCCALLETPALRSWGGVPNTGTAARPPGSNGTTAGQGTLVLGVMRRVCGGCLRGCMQGAGESRGGGWPCCLGAPSALGRW